MSDDGGDERTGATPSGESPRSPDALARAAEQDAKRQRQRAQTERTAEGMPDDTRQDEQEREREGEQQREREQERERRREQERERRREHERLATLEFREWLTCFPAQELWMRAVARDAASEVTLLYPVPESRAAVREEQRDIAARALQEAWTDEVHAPVFRPELGSPWAAFPLDLIPYNYFFGTAGDKQGDPDYRFGYEDWVQQQPESHWHRAVDWKAVAHDLLYTEPEPIRRLLVQTGLHDLRQVDRSDLLSLAVERIIHRWELDVSARDAAKGGPSTLREWWDEQTHARHTYTFSVIPEVDTANADWDGIAARLVRNEQTPARVAGDPPAPARSDARGSRQAQDHAVPHPGDSADDATRASHDDIRFEDIPFGSPPEPPPSPPDADPRFDDRTRAVYQVILNDHQLDEDAWRAVEYACTWWDEDQPLPSRYHDGTTLREHAAEALKEWWTALAETAHESVDTARLDILADHDTERIDWHLIAEHVLDHDGRGGLRTWAHEIPYDPFTPPQPDRSSYRSAGERDGPAARQPAPPSPGPARDVPGGTSRSRADGLVTNIETQELLVDRIDVAQPAGTEAVPSPTRGGDDAAPADPHTTPVHGNTGRENALRTPHDDTGDGGPESQSRAPGEPTLDPWLTDREPTKVQEAPAPAPQSTSGKKLPAPKRMPEVERLDPTRAEQRKRDRANARTTERDTHGRNDGDERDNAPVVPPPEPVVLPPPPPPAPEPEPDFDFDM